MATRPRSVTAASSRRAGSPRRPPHWPTTGPRTFVSASAIGYYGFDRGDALLCEDSVRGDGFLADVVADWEAATAPAAEAGLRVVDVRTGIVQSARGGTLRLMRPLFAAGLGGRLGSGEQWLSWIGLDDLLDVYHRALYDARLTGPVNAVAPEPVRNADYTKALAGVLHRPAVVPVPSLGPRLLLGEQGARELAEANQRVVPTKLAGAGSPVPAVNASLTRWLTNSDTADAPHVSGSRAPSHGFVSRRRRRVRLCAARNSSWLSPSADDFAVAVVGQPQLEQGAVDLGVKLQRQRAAEHERL